ncbi:MAG: hypothetical protein DDT18_01760 [Actinobacteria bacterium]|nr:hypothetical protein [Actinomycetota bacterium]
MRRSDRIKKGLERAPHGYLNKERSRDIFLSIETALPVLMKAPV